MAAHINTDIFCDGCGRWEYGGGTKSPRRARAYVKKRYGWRYVRQDGEMVDLCPECPSALKQEPIPANIFDNMELLSIDEVSRRMKDGRIPVVTD